MVWSFSEWLWGNSFSCDKMWWEKQRKCFIWHYRKKESLCTMWSVTDNFLPFYSFVVIGEESRTRSSLKERSKDEQSIPNMVVSLKQWGLSHESTCREHRKYRTYTLISAYTFKGTLTNYQTQNHPNAHKPSIQPINIAVADWLKNDKAIFIETSPIKNIFYYF